MSHVNASRWALNVSREGEFTTTLGNVFQCFVSLAVKSPYVNCKTKDLTWTFTELERKSLYSNCNSSVVKIISTQLYMLVIKNQVLYLLMLSNAHGIPVGVLKAGSNFSPSSTAFFRKIWKSRRNKVLGNALLLSQIHLVTLSLSIWHKFSQHREAFLLF